MKNPKLERSPKFFEKTFDGVQFWRRCGDEKQFLLFGKRVFRKTVPCCLVKGHQNSGANFVFIEVFLELHLKNPEALGGHVWQKQSEHVPRFWANGQKKMDELVADPHRAVWAFAQRHPAPARFGARAAAHFILKIGAFFGDFAP